MLDPLESLEAPLLLLLEPLLPLELLLPLEPLPPLEPLAAHASLIVVTSGATYPTPITKPSCRSTRRRSNSFIFARDLHASLASSIYA